MGPGPDAGRFDFRLWLAGGDRVGHGQAPPDLWIKMRKGWPVLVGMLPELLDHQPHAD